MFWGIKRIKSPHSPTLLAQLWLEKLRIEYDIRATDFMLPVLSVQPIVENAVYHGLFKKGTGGTVTIRTEETGGGFIRISRAHADNS